MRIAGKLHGFYRNLIATALKLSYNHKYFLFTRESRNKKMTYKDIKHNEEVNELLKRATRIWACWAIPTTRRLIASG